MKKEIKEGREESKQGKRKKGWQEEFNGGGKI